MEGERKVVVAALQFACSDSVSGNVETAERLVRAAHKKGANIVLIQDDQITMSISYKAKQSSGVTRVSSRIPASLGKKSGVTRASGRILVSGRIPMLLPCRAELRRPSGARWCFGGVPVEFQRCSGGGRGGVVPS
ncbi:hypothetical protein IEQ34_017988 [Dendrobium chrysotoxum]|uniref:CN hydrolase domain-containing protein n=1 Tax=Dendrobium chrysotoxum TaxID=161865 RepID=A0AAV7GDB6_DENCH|nr:hypothetical protein IEQ34_017988 [Dendrobium chrysotoxum]